MRGYITENDLKTPFKNSTPGDDYFINFKRRHVFSQKKTQAVEISQKRSADPFIIAEYFRILKEISSDVPPECIYNIDEKFLHRF